MIYSAWFFSNLFDRSTSLGLLSAFFILLSGPFALILLLILKKQKKQEEDPLSRKIQLLEKRMSLALLLLMLALHIQICFLERYEIQGISMEPSLKNGETVWVEKVSAGIPLPDLSFPFSSFNRKKILYGSYRRGDIVLFYYPGMTENSSESFIKRIIGLPGDEYAFLENGIELNGELLNEIYVDKNTEDSFPTREYYPPLMQIPDELNEMDSSIIYSAMNGSGRKGRVPEGTLFLLGDNRLYSRDSRSVGFIPMLFIRGKVYTKE